MVVCPFFCLGTEVPRHSAELGLSVCVCMHPRRKLMGEARILRHERDQRRALMSEDSRRCGERLDRVSRPGTRSHSSSQLL
jgi:hypothetical protein